MLMDWRGGDTTLEKRIETKGIRREKEKTKRDSGSTINKMFGL